MSILLPTDLNALSVIKSHIINDHGVLKITSFEIAQRFNKRHKHVLRDIQKLDCSREFHGSNFGLCFEINELQNGKRIPYYTATKNGFVRLCMSYTGSHANEWKELYILAFDDIAHKLTQTLVENDALKQMVLTHYPLIAKIKRYRELGLSISDVGKLLKLDKSTVRRNLRHMEICGLIEAPDNLAEMQEKASHFQVGIEEGQ